MSPPRTRVVAIVGPTAGGKARLAAAVAQATGLPLLSCDSMKVYRGMDIGTAKPPAELREGIDWRGIDLVGPWESFDASQFRALYEQERAEADRAGRPLVLSGGTMLYLKAATEGLGDVPPRDPALRAQLTAEGEELGAAVLHARLAGVDPLTATKVHPNDLRRIVRALEVHTLTGRPLSGFHGQFGSVRPEVDRRVFAVRRTREDMDRRIDVRVERMLEAGWIEECEALRADPRGISPEAAQAIGYRQILAWLDAGRPCPVRELTAQIQTATRRFARRQLTWIRNTTGVHELQVAEGTNPTCHLDQVLRALD